MPQSISNSPIAITNSPLLRYQYHPQEYPIKFSASLLFFSMPLCLIFTRCLSPKIERFRQCTSALKLISFKCSPLSMKGSSKFSLSHFLEKFSCFHTLSLSSQGDSNLIPYLKSMSFGLCFFYHPDLLIFFAIMRFSTPIAGKLTFLIILNESLSFFE